MKYFALTLLLALAATSWSPAADTPAPSAPRHLAVVTCFNGKIDSGSSCSAKPTQEPAPDAKLKVKRGLICGYPGKVSELQWEFTTQRGEADVYRITRHFPVGATNAQTTTNTVSFSGQRVIIFEDSDQVVVMESAKK